MTLTENILVSLIAGGFGLMPAVLQWIASSSRRRDRTTHLEQLRGELAFLEHWATLRSRASPDAPEPPADPRLRESLDRILHEFHTLGPRDERAAALEELSLVRRALLLYLPPTGRAWWWHTVFYVLVAALGSMLISDWLNPTYTAEGQNEFGYLVAGLAIIFGYPLYRIRRNARREAARVMSGEATAPAAIPLAAFRA